METPKQRSQRILRKDRYNAALENSSAELYLASVQLANHACIHALEIFIQAIQRQAQVFTQYQKHLELMQLRLACLHRLEKEMMRPDTSLTTSI